MEFGAASRLPLITLYRNRLLTQTVSISRALAGGRQGLARGQAGLISYLNRVKYSFNPYNINRLTMLAGTAAVQDTKYFDDCTAAIRQNRAWTVERLEGLGFTVLPSLANFIFAKSDKISGGDLYRELKKKGVLVRWFDTDRIRDYVRITIGSREQMEALTDRIEALLNAQ